LYRSCTPESIPGYVANFCDIRTGRQFISNSYTSIWLSLPSTGAACSPHWRPTTVSVRHEGHPSRHALGGPHGGGLHPRPDRKSARPPDVASLIAKISGVTQAEDVHWPLRRHRARPGRQRRRTRPSCPPRTSQSVPGITRTLNLPRGAHLSSSAARGAPVRGPAPSAAAPRRSDGRVHVPGRSPGMPSRPSSTGAAPPACRAREARPNAGRNAAPRRRGVQRRAVTRSVGHEGCRPRAAAARSARLTCSGRSAGRSADSAAVPSPGQRAAANLAPCRSAGLKARRAARPAPPARPRPASGPPRRPGPSVMTMTRATASDPSNRRQPCRRRRGEGRVSGPAGRREAGRSGQA